MKRYDKLPFEWTRVIWVSKDAKDYWKHRISNLSYLVGMMEAQLVYNGYKRSRLSYAQEKELERIREDAESFGYAVVELERSKMDPDKPYYSSPPEGESLMDYPEQIRYAICHPDDVSKWEDVWNMVDFAERKSFEIGELLGYPDCCRKFFNKFWLGHRFIDTTWPMALNTIGEKLGWENEERTIQVNPDEFASQLLRWLGIRMAYHLPCSFDCPETILMGQKYKELWYEQGYGEEYELLEEILNWPMEWSALHGIAEIKTPVFKISTRTDSTPVKYTVQSMGTVMPEHAAKGVVFPYISGPPKFYTKRSFKESLKDPSLWEENGFGSLEAMNKYHDAIETALGDIEREGNIVDLGCGNGWLVHKLSQDNNWSAHGVEIDHQRYMSSLSIDPHATFTEANIAETSWADRKYSTILLMVGRLTEMTETEEARMISALANNTEYLLLSLTPDWKGTIEEHALDAGLDKYFEPVGELVTDENGKDIAQLWKKTELNKQN